VTPGMLRIFSLYDNRQGEYQRDGASRDKPRLGGCLDALCTMRSPRAQHAIRKIEIAMPGQ